MRNVKIRNETVVAYFTALFQHCEENVKHHEKPQLGQPITRPRFEPVGIQWNSVCCHCIKVLGVNHSITGLQLLGRFQRVHETTTAHRNQNAQCNNHIVGFLPTVLTAKWRLSSCPLLQLQRNLFCVSQDHWTDMKVASKILSLHTLGDETTEAIVYIFSNVNKFKGSNRVQTGTARST